MRDAKEIWHFPISANDDVVMRLTKPNTYRRTARGAASAPKLFLQRSAKFREGMGNGLRQNEDQNHESDRKHSQ